MPCHTSGVIQSRWSSRLATVNVPGPTNKINKTTNKNKVDGEGEEGGRGREGEMERKAVTFKLQLIANRGLVTQYYDHIIQYSTRVRREGSI